MKFSVCTDAVFGGMNTADAMRAVKSCGINAVEFWGWWDKDINGIDKARRELNMSIAAICTRFISLTNPSLRNNYLKGLSETIAVAKKLGCTRIISQVGNAGVSPDADKQSVIDGLKQCAGMLGDAGMVLVIEPLNTKIDHAGYFLESSAEGAEIVAEVGSPNVKLLFDFYHQQITEGGILRNSLALFDSIGHFHAAGVPGRNELDTGEINYINVFSELDKRFPDNGKFIGLEYFPKKDPVEGLKKQYIHKGFADE